MTEEKIEAGYNAGDEVEGEISGMTSFGAFIKLPDGNEGLVHISEISDTYVAKVEEFLKLKDKVKVKILGKNQRGKWELSIKQVGSESQVPLKKAPYKPAYTPNSEKKKKEKNFEEGSFDDIVDKFLKKSDEVQLDVRRNLQYKQGVRKKGKKGKFG